MLPILKKTANKVFVSQAMQHSTPERVHKERDAIIEKLKKVYPNNTFELIDQYHVAEPAEWSEKSPRELRWARLGRSIAMMAEADIIVFAKKSYLDPKSPGCGVEYSTALNYRLEYPGEYIHIFESALDEFIKSKGLHPFHKNIIDCVTADIEIFDEYFEELFTIVTNYIPLLSHEYLVNDTDTEWYLEYNTFPYYLCAELNKCVVLDEGNHDNGEFFKFTLEYESKNEGEGFAQIIIKSFNDGTKSGLKIDNFEMDRVTDEHTIKLFEELKEACE